MRNEVPAEVRAEMEALETLRHARRGESVRRGMRRKAEAGGLPGCAPVGYRNRRDADGNAYVEVDPVQGPLVKEAFELMATGEYPLRKLLAVMDEKGLRSRNGKPLQATGLWRILTNSFYAGFVTWGEESLPGRHEGLVSGQVFDGVRRRLRESRRNAN